MWGKGYSQYADDDEDDFDSMLRGLSKFQEIENTLERRVSRRKFILLCVDAMFSFSRGVKG